MRLHVLLFLTAFLPSVALASDTSICLDEDETDRLKAISACDRAIASGKVKGKDLAELYASRGYELSILENDSDRSLNDLNEAIRINPANIQALTTRGVGWMTRRDYDRAIDDFTSAISISMKTDKDPDDLTIAYGDRGEAWRLKGDLDKALADLNKAIAIESVPDPLHLARRADVYRFRGDLDRALADNFRAIKADGDDFPFAYTSRGLTYDRKGDLKNARLDFEKALSFPPLEYDTSREAQETARARLAAITSGVAQPIITTAPVSIGAKSIPTQVVSAPLTTSLQRERRAALVIGNSGYVNVPALPNPIKDAATIAATLRNVGFESVTLATDVTHEQMIIALRNFANEAEKSDWAMVYYAGHGMEVGGVNYLIPVDAKIVVDRDIQVEAVPLTQVLNAGDTAKKIKLIMLDACRDNPFTPRKTAVPEVAAAVPTSGAPIKTRSANGRGLAEVKVTGATLVVYAAKDGQVALDGEGGNSPFAVAVVQRLATPGVEINKLFRLVRDDVMEATAGRQEPYTYGSLPGKEDFFFVAK